jgi:CheY-like chemotaxis protein
MNPAILEALSKFAWPLLAAVVLWKFYPAIRKVIDSRTFTVKIGGLEVTVQDATEQLGSTLEDLKQKVAQLRAEVAGPSGSLPTEARGTSGVFAAPKIRKLPSAILPRRILWVDDKPEKKAFFIDGLKSEGIEIIEARSTSEAADRILSSPADIGLVISDMSRWEGSTVNPEAGIELIKLIRETNLTVPVIVFDDKRKTARYGVHVIEIGGDGMTWSPVELFELVHAYIPLPTGSTSPAT